jgi:gas vesicle protein
MKGQIILGVLAGMSVGALLAVLMAPDKGSVTRKKLVGRGDDYYNSLQEKVDELKEKYEELMSKMADKYAAVKEAASLDNGVPGLREL